MINASKILFLIILSVLCTPIYGQFFVNKVDETTDSVTINAIELKDIDFKIKIAFQYYLKYLNRDFNKNEKNNYVVFVIIAVPTNLIEDSVYEKYDFSRFENLDFEEWYSFLFEIVKKSSKNIYGYSNFKKYFIYNFQDWEIIFATNLPINFKDTLGLKTIQFQIQDKNKEGSYMKISSCVLIYQIIL